MTISLPHSFLAAFFGFGNSIPWKSQHGYEKREELLMGIGIGLAVHNDWMDME